MEAQPSPDHGSSYRYMTLREKGKAMRFRVLIASYLKELDQRKQLGPRVSRKAKDPTYTFSSFIHVSGVFLT